MDSQRPIIVVTGSRQEHELFMMGYSVLFGLVVLLGGGADNPVFRHMERFSFTAWCLLMIASGAAVLTGCFWRQNVSTGLFLEQLGLYVNSGCVFIFGGIAFQVAGSRAAFTAGICLAWILANVARAWRVGKDQRQLRRARRVSAAE